MASLGNFVQLSNDIPKRLHFTAWKIVEREITDPHTKSPKKAKVLQLDVSREDGIQVSKTYSVLSEKHAQQLAPYLENQSFLRFDFIITRRGRGFLTEYTVRIEPTT